MAAAMLGGMRRSGRLAGDASVRPSVTTSVFGTTPEGKEAKLFTLRNRNGVEVRATTYGGTIVSLRTPDRNGRLDDIVLGFDRLESYAKESPYFGAIIGRYGNRIARGRFTLDGETYALATNDGPNHLHGGRRGFDKVVWRGEPFEDDTSVGVVFTYR
ncbi:MAG: galactose-1-epimerase, partial [Gemmatimonadetes bacterium]|nr:galactose-1-epimerase [Gemmatimonadota bacterium]